MINDSEIELPRTNTNEYIVPFRLTSYTGQLYTYEIDNVTKSCFMFLAVLEVVWYWCIHLMEVDLRMLILEKV